jgi:FkbM family methyltransferase
MQEMITEIDLDTSKLDLNFIQFFSPLDQPILLANLRYSKSQIRQDLFVLCQSKYKKGGYFVEFGAANGIHNSNTFLLETKFSWKGILVEPAAVWRNSLYENRPNAIIETMCVWKDSNSTLIFNETIDGELSTIDTFTYKDGHYKNRLRGKKYEVLTISLIDLLLKNNAPRYIDYLSIDTEGSEFEILNAFNFKEYTFGIISIEHNFTPQRELIFELLTNNGYKIFGESISHIDDWYIKI